MKYKDIENNKEEKELFKKYCYSNYCKEIFDTWRIRDYDIILSSSDYGLYRLNYLFKKLGEVILKTIFDLYNNLYFKIFKECFKCKFEIVEDRDEIKNIIGGSCTCFMDPPCGFCTTNVSICRKCGETEIENV